MNVFKSIGLILDSLTGTVVEVCKTTETAARTAHKAVSLAEQAVDAMIAEQAIEIAQALKDAESK